MGRLGYKAIKHDRTTKFVVLLLVQTRHKCSVGLGGEGTANAMCTLVMYVIHSSLDHHRQSCAHH